MSAPRPVVSVVIPVYNAAAYVQSTIQSVLDQTYDRIECIVIDDGSTDDTPDVIARFSSSVRIERMPNAGVSAARNVGVGLASGELIAFLDADDLWLPMKVARQVEAYRPGCGLVYTGYAIVDERLDVKTRILPTPWEARRRAVATLSGYGIGFGATAMLPRHVLDDVGPFDTRLSTGADADYVWRVGRRYAAIGIDEALVMYRQHASQMHADLDAFQHDMTCLLAKVRDEDGLSRLADVGTANVHTYIGLHLARRGRLRGAVRHLRAALTTRPSRVVAFPVDAARRRVLRRAWGRWPWRSQLCESVVA